ncbi:hypothetical protein K7432_017960 [Basidiobolus ranarum]|uniref:Uncharacterized protein n=1 Tax=Basidiobolus ranarum TaxID=34480 RepID=A0ABR2VJN3_9FUNG
MEPNHGSHHEAPEKGEQMKTPPQQMETVPVLPTIVPITSNSEITEVVEVLRAERNSMISRHSMVSRHSVMAEIPSSSEVIELPSNSMADASATSKETVVASTTSVGEE